MWPPAPVLYPGSPQVKRVTFPRWPIVAGSDPRVAGALPPIVSAVAGGKYGGARQDGALVRLIVGDCDTWMDIAGKNVEIEHRIEAHLQEGLTIQLLCGPLITFDKTLFLSKFYLQWNYRIRGSVRLRSRFGPF